MNKFLMIFMLVAGLFSNSFASEISVRVSDSKVSLDESFTVVFSVNQKIYEQPDFSPILKDFDILSSSAATSTTIINGQVTEEIRWTMSLIAKHEGKLTLPSITIGQLRSAPREIEITGNAELKNDDAIFIEVENNPTSTVYQQTPLVCTVKLYCSLHLTQGKLTELETNDPNAMVVRVGADAQYEKFHNGKRYMIVERKYMIVPERIGELTIKPILFEGHVIGKSYSMFDAQTNFKRVSSNQHVIDVKSLPANFNENKWIAANDLKLTENWSKDPNSLNLGDSVTWTLTLTADGAIAKTLPDLPLKFPKDMKSYIDKPESSDQITVDGIRATKEVKVALIPTKTGEYAIPDLVIEWWDLNIDQKRELKLSGRVIKVTGEEEIAMANPITHELISLKNEEEPVTKPAKDEDDDATNLFVGLLGAIALLLLLGFYLKTKPKNSKSQIIKQIRSGLKHACQTNDPKKAEKYLLALAELMFPEIKPVNLMTIKPYLTDRLQHEIDELSKHLYGQNNTWDGSTLWNAWVAFKPKKQFKFKSKQNNDLRELYPK